MKTLFGLIMFVLITSINIGQAVANAPPDQEQQICMDYDVGITQMDVSVNVEISASVGKSTGTDESSFEFIYLNKSAEISPNDLLCNCKNEQRYRQAKTKTVKANPYGYPLKYPFRDKEKRA